MLVYVQPPNEVLLRARVLGAQDQYEYLSILFIARALQAKKRFFGGATFTFFTSAPVIRTKPALTTLKPWISSAH